MRSSMSKALEALAALLVVVVLGTGTASAKIVHQSEGGLQRRRCAGWAARSISD